MCEGVSLDNVECREEYKTYTSFWILGVAGTLIASLGIFLNTFGLFIVWKSKEKHLFQRLIVCLLIFDTILLFFSVMDFSFRGLKYRSTFIVYGFSYFVHPGFYIFLFCSIYMTVCISHERYSALQDPIRYSQKVYDEEYQNRKIKKCSSYIIFSSILYNIFRFFEYRLDCVQQIHSEHVNETMFVPYTKFAKYLNCSYPDVEYVVVQMNDQSLLHKDKDHGTFRTAISVADSIVLGIIPFLLLIFLNSRIHCCIKQQREYIRVSTLSGEPLLPDKEVEIRKKEIKIRKNEIKMALTFIAIVAAFLCCHSVKLLFSLIAASNYEKYYEHSERWFILMEYIGLLLIVVKSTLNVFFYGLFGKKFREESRKVMDDLFSCKFNRHDSNEPSKKSNAINKKNHPNDAS